MASTAELELIIKARDEASGVLGAVSKKAGGLAGVMGKAVRVGALAGGVAVAGLGIAAVKMGLDFEKSMAEVQTLLPDLSEEGFGQLRSGVLDLSKELGIATDQAVPALYSAISQGVPPDNVLEFMKTAAKASIGGVTDLDTAVKVISGTINTYGADVIDAQTVSDVLFTAVKLGGTTFGELGASLSKVLPTASAIGVSFEDVTSQIAVMTSQMVPTAESVTLMKQLFSEASKTGTDLADAILDLTGRSFAELIDKGASTSEILDSVRDSMPEQEFKDLFGSTEAMNAALLVTGPNAQAAADALAEAQESAGATDAAFDVMADTASFKLNKAINLLKVTLTEVGIKILPLLTKALDKALPFLEENLPKAMDKIEKAIRDARPTVEEFIRIFSTGLGVLKAAIEPLFRFIIVNKPVLIAAIAAIGIAILLAFGPGAIAIVAIIGLIALIGLIRDNWDMLKQQFADIQAFVTNIPVIGALVEAMVAVVKDKIDAAIEIFLGLKALIEEVVTFVKAIIEGDWSQAWASAKEIVKIALNLLIDFVRTTFLGTMFVLMKELGPKILDGIGDLASLLFQKGVDLLEGLLRGAVEISVDLIDFFIGLPGTILSAIGDLARVLWSAGWNLLSGLWDGIRARAVQLFNDLRQLANDIIGAITDPLGIFSPSKVMQGVGVNLMEGLRLGIEGQAIKVNATVGNVSAGVIGVAAAPAGSRIGVGGGQTIVVHIHDRAAATRRQARQIARDVGEELEKDRLLT